MVVTVEVSAIDAKGPMILEPTPEMEESGLRVDSILWPEEDKLKVLICNSTGLTQTLDSGEQIGRAEEVDIISTNLTVLQDANRVDGVVSQVVSTTEQERRSKVLDIYKSGLQMSESDTDKFCKFLADHHAAFCLAEGERGETDMVQMNIDTMDAVPRRQAPRRMPFAVRSEIDKQVQKMANAGVIQKSHSPWASPVVPVRKCNGNYRFCVDYRKLNEVTKRDKFPLPRIDDLLDQLPNSNISPLWILLLCTGRSRWHPIPSPRQPLSPTEGCLNSE